MARYKDDGGKVPAGDYLFKIIEEPTFHKFGKMVAVKFILKAIADDGTVYRVKQSLPRWECGDIWRAIGFEKDAEGFWDIDETECVGKTFEAKIVYEPDKKDPKKMWYRVKDVVIPELSDGIPPGMYGREPEEEVEPEGLDADTPPVDVYEDEQPSLPEEDDDEVPF